MNQEPGFSLPPSYQPKLKIDRKIYIITACFIISVLFWFLIALSDSYSTLLSVPIRYTNLPQQKVITNALPPAVEINVTTTGFRILGYQLGRKPDSVTLDVSARLPEVRIAGNELVAISTDAALAGSFVHQLGSEYTINAYYPDSITFSFSSRTGKRVPVRFNSSITYATQYGVSGDISLVPDSVTLYGPEQDLAEMREAETEPLILSDVRTAISTTLSLKKHPRVTTSSVTISVNIPVDKFTEGEMQVPVHTINLKRGYMIKLYPEKVIARYRVAMSNYNSINPQMFSVAADADGLPDNGSRYLRLNVITSPDAVKLIALIPDKVEYVLQKK